MTTGQGPVIVVFAFAGEADSMVTQNAASNTKPNLAVRTLADTFALMVHSFTCLCSNLRTRRGGSARPRPIVQLFDCSIGTGRTLRLNGTNLRLTMPVVKGKPGSWRGNLWKNGPEGGRSRPSAGCPILSRPLRKGGNHERVN